MKELQQYKFSDFLKIEMGQSPSSEYVNLEGIGLPLLNGPAEFTNTYPIPIQYSTEGNKIANAKDILFCVRGSTTGRMNIADQQYIIGRGLAAISHKEGKYLNSYVKGLLEYHLKFLIGGTCGSVFPNLTKEQLFNYTCYLPSLQVQEKIASILSSLDDKIELNNQLNDNLPN